MKPDIRRIVADIKLVATIAAHHTDYGPPGGIPRRTAARLLTTVDPAALDRVLGWVLFCAHRYPRPEHHLMYAAAERLDAVLTFISVRRAEIQVHLSKEAA